MRAVGGWLVHVGCSAGATITLWQPWPLPVRAAVFAAAVGAALAGSATWHETIR